MKLAAVCLAALLVIAGSLSGADAPKPGDAPASATATAPAPTPTKAAATATSTAKATTPSSKEFVVDLAKPDSPLRTVAGKQVKFDDFVDLLAAYAKSVPNKAQQKIVVRADPEIPFGEMAKMIMACRRADIGGFDINGLHTTVPLSGSDDAAAKKAAPQRQIKIELRDDEAKDGGISIILNGGQKLGKDFDSLRRRVAEAVAGGRAKDTVVIMTVTASTPTKYVLQVCRIAADAGVAGIEYSWPYEFEALLISSE